MKHLPTLLADFISKGYPIKLINETTYLWDYALRYNNDGANRWQRVYLGEITENDRDLLFIRSHIADFSDQLSPIQLLREANFLSLGSICLKKYTKSDGTEVEGVYTQCIFPVYLAQQHPDEFLKVVHEIANQADFIEKTYLNTDLT